MAITESGIYLQNFVDILDATAQTFDYTNDTIRCALVTDTETPNFDTDTAFADVSANEVGASGSYASKGDALASKTLAVASGQMEFDAANTAYTSATITAMAAVILNDTTATPVDALICLLDFVSDVTSTSGTFTVQYPANGYIQIPHV